MIKKINIKTISFSELRYLYKNYLKQKSLENNTIKTIYTDSFYILKNSNKDIFWEVVETENDSEAKNILKEILKQKSKTNTLDKTTNSYWYHLKRFRQFCSNPDNIKPPLPSIYEVNRFLKKWNKLENYLLQEQSLDKLFHKLIPKNTNIIDILIKVSTLNDFYSTNILSVFPVAQKIHNINNLDKRLESGDISLVDEIKLINLKNKTVNFFKWFLYIFN